MQMHSFIKVPCSISSLLSTKIFPDRLNTGVVTGEGWINVQIDYIKLER